MIRMIATDALAGDTSSIFTSGKQASGAEQ
jgi:hypothetical protein